METLITLRKPVILDWMLSHQNGRPLSAEEVAALFSEIPRHSGVSACKINDGNGYDTGVVILSGAILYAESSGSCEDTDFYTQRVIAFKNDPHGITAITDTYREVTLTAGNMRSWRAINEIIKGFQPANDSVRPKLELVVSA
ncbi:hypothetical protein IJJ18_00970 [Candidatus Saccharibacteria bacterium]|nr:hypothetical protein [Candidatus Saccharibacteria bacterium]